MTRFACVLSLALSACFEAPVAKPTITTYQETPIRVPQNLQNKVDVLFMVDNSPSMGAMQSELQAKFGQFFSVFQDLAAKGTYADLHVGVVTSDYGAGATAVTRGCDKSPGGDHGHLQQLGVAAPPGCAGPSDRFIRYAFNAGAPATNLPAGQDLVQTFTCMASVGAAGCGFEHQLESVRAALKDADGFNAGFLRDDALLTVVFVTNEDDGSAPPDADFYSNSPAKVAMYGAYDTYRQTRFAIACGNPPMSPPYPMSGPVLESGCGGAPNLPADGVGGAYEVARYINLFTKPLSAGGIKDNPQSDIVLVAIDAPEAPFNVVTVDKSSGGGAGATPRYVPCAPADGVNCMVRLDHSCQNAASPAFFGDPPLRINSVVRSAAALHWAIANICSDDNNAAPDYSPALAGLAQLISSLISPGCIPAPLADVAHPDCVVEDITHAAGGVSTVPIAQCDAGAPSYPCWRVETKDKCADQSPQSLGVTIDRGPGGMAPDHTNAHVECTTVATKT